MLDERLLDVEEENEELLDVVVGAEELVLGMLDVELELEVTALDCEIEVDDVDEME